MIRNDFINGGFPICSRNPVICVTNEGKVFVSYDRLTLIKTLSQPGIIKCLGVWPGKQNTDLFPLSPEAYSKIAPPEDNRDIDDCTDIQIHCNKNGELLEVSYLPAGSSTRKTSKKPLAANLADYIISLGLIHKVIYDKD